MSFVVYRSSAGSGKTYTLVREYLAMILPEPENFRHILAITFTNKAANEMKERVLAMLAGLAKPENERNKKFPPDLVRQLVGQTGLEESKIRMKAGQALGMILHDYSEFSIGTIDSFSNRIIRAFAHDFGLPVNFELEMDEDELLETAVSLLLDKIGTDKELTAFLVRFLESRMDDEQDWDIERIFLDFAKVLLKEEAAGPVMQLKDLTLDDFGKIAFSVRRYVRDYEARIKDLAEKAMQLIRSGNISPDAFYYKNKGIWGYFDKLSRGGMETSPNSYAEKSIHEDKWTSGDATEGDREKIGLIQGDLVTIHQSIQEEVQQNGRKYYLMKAVQKTIYPMAVLNEISNLLEAYKKENNIVHISEFNRRIAGFILNEPVPFIYERMGEKFSHILIDEFQDTSLLQWHNLLPLVENALAGANFNLVVGDGKQAIYRWRNGDVRQFTALPSLPGSASDPVIASRERLIRQYFTEEKLDKNFRSREGIVAFNNDFFGKMKSSLGPECRDIYANLEQKHFRSGPGGFVRMDFVPADLSRADARQYTLDRILENIQELESGQFRKQDIVILCRKKSEGSEIARFLTGKGINVISAESLLLSYSPEVLFLTGFARFLFHEDLLVLAELFRFLFSRNLLKAGSLHELMVLASTADRPLQALISRLAGNGIILDPDLLKTLPLYDLLEEIIRRFSLLSSPDPYIQFFLDEAFQFQRKRSSNVPDFLQWWDDHKDSRSIRMPEGLDAVRIMTVHKAKGLEFPAVIAPFFPDRNRLTKSDLWVELHGNEIPGLKVAMLKTDKNLEETEYCELYREEKEKSRVDQLNVLYVAMTRAEERLYVISPVVSSEKAKMPDNIPAFLCGYIYSLGEDPAALPSFTFGEKNGFEAPARNEGPEPLRLRSLSSGDWRDKLLLRTNAPESWDMEDPQRNRQWGNLLHTLLGRIDSPEDVDRILREVTDAGIVEPGLEKGLKEKILSIINHPEIAPFFRSGMNVKSEAEILLKNGSVYRPDRVIIEGKTASVIDFKTGRNPEAQERQVNLYGKLLKEMGYEKVRKYLLYLEPEIQLTEVK